MAVKDTLVSIAMSKLMMFRIWAIAVHRDTETYTKVISA